jgi:hypothetical protein
MRKGWLVVMLLSCALPVRLSAYPTENDPMASKEQLDQYAAELIARFDDLTKWAIENWPRQDFPLMHSDFAESRREFSKIAGPKLGEGEPQTTAAPAEQDRQYRDMNPAPWP